MANGRIIKPQGKPVKEVIIQLDANGQAAVIARTLNGLAPRPVPGGEVALILSQVLTSVIVSSLMGTALPIQPPISSIPEPDEKTPHAP